MYTDDTRNPAGRSTGGSDARRALEKRREIQLKPTPLSGLDGTKGIRLGQPADHFVGDHSLLFNFGGALSDRWQQRVDPDQESVCVACGRLAGLQSGGHGNPLVY